MINLNDLGTNICIIGNCATGKSTLAQSLANKLDLPFCHLDQIAYIPYTDWQPRGKKLISRDHSVFLNINKKWVIEGNYSFLMENRFAHATSIIWLNFSTANSLFRYIKQTLFDVTPRVGIPEGSKNKLILDMFSHILIDSPKNKIEYKELITNSGIKHIEINNSKQLLDYYNFWELNIKQVCKD